MEAGSGDTHVEAVSCGAARRSDAGSDGGTVNGGMIPWRDPTWGVGDRHRAVCGRGQHRTGGWACRTRDVLGGLLL